MTPFTGLAAHAYLHPDDRERFLKLTLVSVFNHTKSSIANIACCVMIAIHRHATMRAVNYLLPQRQFTDLVATAGTDLRRWKIPLHLDKQFACQLKYSLENTIKLAARIIVCLVDERQIVLPHLLPIEHFYAD